MNIEKMKILKELNNALKGIFLENLRDVILFGSRLSYESDSESDYDILVILKQKADWKTERLISDICYDFELKYSVMIDAHVIGEDELSGMRGKQPIFVNAISSGLHA